MKTISLIIILNIATLHTAKTQISDLNSVNNHELNESLMNELYERQAEYKTLIQEAGYFESINSYRQALNIYTKAIEIDHQNPIAYAKRGNIYLELNRIRKSADDIVMAIKLDSTFSEAYKNLGKLHFAHKNSDLAIIAYSKSIEFNPNCAESYFYRAMTYFYLDNEDKAINDLVSGSLLNCPKAKILLEKYYMEEVITANKTL